MKWSGDVVAVFCVLGAVGSAVACALLFSPVDVNRDYFGTDTLNVLTDDNGNTGTGGPASDSDALPLPLRS